MRVLLVVVAMLVLAGVSDAKEIAGVQVAPSVTVNDQTLMLNGSGIRRKFLIKVYVGSLYSAKPLRSAAEALRDPHDKLIRMNFLYSRVEKEKIIDAFKEGLRNNSPGLVDSAEARKFLSLFTADFKKGDVVDLGLGGDGTVTAKHNGKVLGTVVSKRLAEGILAIYLGEKPADEELKKGMLGKG